MSRKVLTIDILPWILAVTGHGRQFGSYGSADRQRTTSEALTVLREELLVGLVVVAHDEGRPFAIRLHDGRC